MFVFFHSNFLKIYWPDGTYGLPEPTTGCPIGWLTGSTYHNTEDDQNNNRRSNFSNHFSGMFNSRGIEQNFCIKVNSLNNSNETLSNKILWPDGQYCIYKKGDCPTEMLSGSIYWDDEKSQQDLPNSHEGALPDGNYTLTSTLIEFCCKTNGSVDIPINLPTEIPFYLFPYKNKTCQKVSNMNVTFINLFLL